MNNNNKQYGVGMVEVLVALLVMSLGLMGMTALQLSSLQVSRETLMRSQANILAYDIVDRMRANRASAQQGGQYLTAFNKKIAATDSCDTAECSRAQLASYDIANWKSQLALQLPEGEGQVTRAVGNPPVFTVSVRYKDRADAWVRVDLEAVL